MILFFRTKWEKGLIWQKPSAALGYLNLTLIMERFDAEKAAQCQTRKVRVIKTFECSF